MAKLCVALDVDPEKALYFVDLLSSEPVVFKVGPVLFLRGGPGIINGIKEAGREVFLDLKLHDIPNTVGGAVSVAEDMGVDYLTIHTLVGHEAMEEAVRRATRVKLIGVTLLTSHDEGYLSYLRSGFKSIREMVLHLAKTAKEIGLKGVVCSAGEVYEVKKATGLFTVVPGVRVSAHPGDQRRVSTPEEAAELGADMIVMGREIYSSRDPLKVVRYVLKSIGSKRRL